MQRILPIRSAAVLALGGSIAACAGNAPGPSGPPVAASALCAQVAQILCDADQTCCHTSGTTCHTTQTASCDATLGALVTDPRLAYVPEQGGALLADLRTRAAGCWEEPFHPSELVASFAGTGAVGVSCTPSSGTLTIADLRAGALSCRDGAACRIHLDVDGRPRGVCEAREVAGTEVCSHAYDCTGDEWCDLRTGWTPGDWGSCQPPRADGWDCTSDLQCASGYCGPDGCTTRPQIDRCLSIAYPDLVRASGPVAYFRLGETSGHSAANAVAGASAGTYVDPIGHASMGAIEGDTDGGLALTGMGGHVELASLAMPAATAITLELWVATTMGGGGPLLELKSTTGVTIRLTLAGSAVTATFLGAGATAMPVELASPAMAIGAGFHHVALTSDGTTSRLYVDGAQVAMLAGAQAIPTTSAVTIGFHANAAPAMSTSLAGSIDEVAIYPTALSASTLLGHATVGQTGPLDNENAVLAWSR